MRTTGLGPRTALALLLALGCGSGGDPVTGTLHVLFIGNSLTYVNDMPNMVVLLGQASNQVTLEVTDVSNPDYALEDHWNLPQTMDVLNAGGWDVVILQQGPSSTPENQVNLEEWATRFGERIRSRGGRPALYMVWPDVTRLSFFDAVRESYTNAAEAADADLYPVGEAWRAAWREDPSLPLYSDDGYHPSLMGSYLAALTIFHGITRRTVQGLPAPSGIPAEVVPLLQRAAEEATAQFGRPQAARDDQPGGSYSRRKTVRPSPSPHAAPATRPLASRLNVSTSPKSPTTKRSGPMADR